MDKLKDNVKLSRDNIMYFSYHSSVCTNANLTIKIMYARFVNTLDQSAKIIYITFVPVPEGFTKYSGRKPDNSKKNRGT